MTTPPRSRAILSADRVYEYTDANGTVEFLVCRWNATADKPKRFAQYHVDAITGQWVAKAPPATREDGSAYLRPLYDLPALAASPDAPVLIVEGEKTWAGAARYLPDGWLVTTWAGGSNAIDKTDWSSLATRRVAIWADNDEAGHKAAARIGAITGGWVLPLPDTLPVKWDLGDDLPADISADDVTAMISRDKPLPPIPIEKPIMLPGPPAYVTEGPEPEVRGEKMNGHGVELPVDYIRTDRGGIKPIFANAVFMLRKHEHKWKLRYDDFSQRAFSDGEALSDSRMREIAEWMQYEGLAASTATISEAIVRAAELTRFHPVREYLDSLVWDEISRIDHILIDHAGAHDDDQGLTRAFTSKWLIQAVARIYDPGCHARGTLVLEGPQDIGKSTIFREIFGDRWFTDHLPDIANKDALLQIRGIWCVEIAELATLGRADSAKIKQFLTSRVDRYRDPYGRLVADYPRTCVFGGTVNPGARGYLKDETGGTRFWPIAVGKVDIAAFRDYRDQIWAEAVYRYRSGEIWHLTGDIVEAAMHRQAERYEGDPWEEKIMEYVTSREEVTIPEIFKFCLNMNDEGDWSQGDLNRIGRCLGGLGWTRIQRRIGPKRKSVYIPPKPPESIEEFKF